MSIYDFSARLSTGEERHLADFRGKVLLVVNVASKCGFTPQYQGLQNLCEQFGPRGFEVLPMRPVRPSGAGVGCGDLGILRDDPGKARRRRGGPPVRQLQASTGWSSPSPRPPVTSTQQPPANPSERPPPSRN